MHHDKSTTRQIGQRDPIQVSKALLEEQWEIGRQAREKFGVTSHNFLPLSFSSAQLSPVAKCVRAPNGMTYPGLPARHDILVIVTAGGSEGESIQGNKRTRWRSSAGTIKFVPANVPIEQIQWQGAEMSTAINVGDALSQIEECRIGLIDSHVFDLAQRLQYQAEHAVPLGLAYVEALMLTLTSYLRGSYGGQRRAHERDIGRLSRLQCEEMQAYIDAHIEENISLSDLATRSGCSVTYLMRLFKQAFGMPPHRYIIERRVERAKVLLKLGRSHSIAEVAAACGFANQAHMQTLFKRLTGMTPGTFRRG